MLQESISSGFMPSSQSLTSVSFSFKHMIFLLRFPPPHGDEHWIYKLFLSIDAAIAALIVRAISSKEKKLTLVQGAENQTPPQGFIVQSCAFVYLLLRSHSESSTASTVSFVKVPQKTSRVCTPCPQSTEHWTTKFESVKRRCKRNHISYVWNLPDSILKQTSDSRTRPCCCILFEDLAYETGHTYHPGTDLQRHWHSLLDVIP